MVTILHLDDNPIWLEAVQSQLTNVKVGSRAHPIEVLSRLSIEEAEAVLNGSDERARELTGQGCSVEAVLLDLMMGGDRESVGRWIESVSSLLDTDRGEAVQRLRRVCPAAKFGSQAAKAGLIVMAVTNVPKFLRADRMDVETERSLILDACGAVAYVVKAEGDWIGAIRDTLSMHLADRRRTRSDAGDT
jgi:CheY-like chemotaxis protein